MAGVENKELNNDALQRVEFGNARAEWVRVADINRLQQTRQEYAPEGISELAESMVYEDETGERRFELIHDLTIGVFDDDELEQYIRDHEDFYGEKVNFSELSRSDDGLWYVAIAGHRRSLAIEENCAKQGIAFEDAYVASSLKRGIRFEEALVLQLRENVHLRPPAVDEAKQIDRYYQLRSRREGVRPTIASCSRVLGFSETKVSEALRFAGLPDAVQQEAAAGLLAYGHAVELHGYVKALERYYGRKYAHLYHDPESGRTLAKDVSDGTMVLVKKIKSDELKGMTARKKTDVIKANINSIIEAGSYHDGELFVLEEEMISPEQRLRRTEANLSKQAIAILVQRLKSAPQDLTPSERAMLGDLTSLLGANTQPDLHSVPDEGFVFTDFDSESVA